MAISEGGELPRPRRVDKDLATRLAGAHERFVKAEQRIVDGAFGDPGAWTNWIDARADFHALVSQAETELGNRGIQ
jgi:hypothetical protein